MLDGQNYSSGSNKKRTHVFPNGHLTLQSDVSEQVTVESLTDLVLRVVIMDAAKKRPIGEFRKFSCPTIWV